MDPGSDNENLMLFAQDDGPTLTDLQKAAPYYRVRITVQEGPGQRNSWSVRYVPSAELTAVRGEGGGIEWVDAPDEYAAAMRKVARDLRPIPAARMRPWMPAPLPPARRRGCCTRASARQSRCWPGSRRA